MARVSVTTKQITRTGLDPAPAAPTVDGDVVDTGAVFLYVQNVGASARIVTVQATVTQDGLALAHLAVSVPAGATRLIGPLPARTFGRVAGGADAGRAYVDYATPADWLRSVIAL